MTDVNEAMMRNDSLVWAYKKRLNLRDGITFTLKDMSYLFDIISCDKKIVNVKKGAQLCLTTSFFIDAVHACFSATGNDILQIKDGVTVIWQGHVYDSQEFTFPEGISGSKGALVTAELGAGAGNASVNLHGKTF